MLGRISFFDGEQGFEDFIDLTYITAQARTHAMVRWRSMHGVFCASAGGFQFRHCRWRRVRAVAGNFGHRAASDEIEGRQEVMHDWLDIGHGGVFRKWMSMCRTNAAGLHSRSAQAAGHDARRDRATVVRPFGSPDATALPVPLFSPAGRAVPAPWLVPG